MNDILSEALRQFVGLLEQLIRNLLGNDAEIWGNELKKFLRKEPCWVKAVEWVKSIWKQITLGTFKNVDEVRTALKKADCNIGDWANDILKKPAFTLSTEKKTLDLVSVTVAELGFKSGAKYSDICQRASELGLDLCPAEVGPQSALQFGSELKRGEWFVIAMEAITHSGGSLNVFNVERDDDGGLWLYGRNGYPDHFWRADVRFVFVPRKN